MRIVGILLIGACWHEPATAPMAPAQPTGVVIEAPKTSAFEPPRRLPSPTSPYAEVAGTWRGIGYQYDTRGHWDIEMTLQRRGEIGDVIGSIAYENGGCTANLIREAERGERGEVLVMRERLVTGHGKCVDNGWIRIPRRPVANELDWRWDFADHKEGASASVKRD